MKRMFLAIAVPATFILCLGCESPQPPALERRSLPVPEVVSRAAIPRPFSSSTYFAYGGSLGGGVDSVLSEVLHKGIPILDGWYPKTALCMAPLVDYLIVRLAAPDPRIEAFGFTRDSSRASVECMAAFLHYNFRNAR